MTQTQMNYLMCAANEFAMAAASICDAVASCNEIKEDKAIAAARLFDLSIAISQIRRANYYFDEFLKMRNISRYEIDDLPTGDKRKI